MTGPATGQLIDCPDPPPPPGNAFTRSLRSDRAPTRGLLLALGWSLAGVVITWSTSLLAPLLAFTDGWNAAILLSLGVGPILAVLTWRQVPEPRFGMLARVWLVLCGCGLMLSAPGALAVGQGLVGVRHHLTQRHAQRIVDAGDPAPRGAEVWLALPLEVEEDALGDLHLSYDMAFPVRCRATVPSGSRSGGGRVQFDCRR